MIVVSVPDPANIGKPSGTILPELPRSGSARNRLIPSTNSMPRIKITIEPATANDCTSTPIRWSIFSPRKRKSTIRQPANKVEIAGCISTDLFFILMMMGTAPITSITAKSVNVTVSISAILNMRQRYWKIGHQMRHEKK